ncbi:MAG: aldehyde dehydrogenase family protein, partial [Catenulispora sp.]|nr:aldehyde dehydrogenase family protein [Catenulispora sp.]
MDAITHTPSPVNEPVRAYAAGSAEAASLQRRVAELAGERRDLPMTIAGRRRMAAGERIEVVQPHNHKHVLGETANASAADVADAVAAAKAAAPAWRALPFDERA